jgi:hypothetical protein
MSPDNASRLPQLVTLTQSSDHLGVQQQDFLLVGWTLS